MKSEWKKCFCDVPLSSFSFKRFCQRCLSAAIGEPRLKLLYNRYLTALLQNFSLSARTSMTWSVGWQKRLMALTDVGGLRLPMAVAKELPRSVQDSELGRSRSLGIGSIKPSQSCHISLISPSKMCQLLRTRAISHRVNYEEIPPAAAALVRHPTSVQFRLANRRAAKKFTTLPAAKIQQQLRTKIQKQIRKQARSLTHDSSQLLGLICKAET